MIIAESTLKEMLEDAAVMYSDIDMAREELGLMEAEIISARAEAEAFKQIAGVCCVEV